MKNMLLASDLHLTDNPHDAYRFDLFPWLLEKVVKYDHPRVVILGDLTDHKDRHPASLVRKIVESIRLLSKETEVTILAGNHDCIDPKNPFFSSIFEGMPNVDFIIKPKFIWSDLFLPHSRQPIVDWEGINFSGADRIFMHQTMNQSMVSNGTRIDGLPASVFGAYNGDIYSGDVHVPQKIGKVTYVGSPYHVHFGDKFTPRCLLLRDDKRYNLHFPCLRKHVLTVRHVHELELDDNVRSGDHVKITVKLARSEFVEWENKREEVYKKCDELGLVVFDVDMVEYKRPRINEPDTSTSKLSASPLEVFDRFCDKENVNTAIREVGKGFLDEVPSP